MLYNAIYRHYWYLVISMAIVSESIKEILYDLRNILNETKDALDYIIDEIKKDNSFEDYIDNQEDCISINIESLDNIG